MASPSVNHQGSAQPASKRSLVKGFPLRLKHMLMLFKTKLVKDRPRVPILEVPNEIILLIAGHLELHDVFLLSQTCRAMRSVLYQRSPTSEEIHGWLPAILRLSYGDMVKFLVGIAAHRPDHWVCPRCCKLHAFRYDDTPTVPRDSNCVGDDSDSWRRFGMDYHICYRHVQVAIKQSKKKSERLAEEDANGRRPPRRYQVIPVEECHPYLDRVMEEYSRQLQLPPPSLRWHRFVASPKVVDGRFLLRQEWTFFGHSAGCGFPPLPIRLVPISWTDIRLCPHRVYPPPWLMPETRPPWVVAQSRELEDTVWRAEYHRSEMFSHCDRCPMDYSVEVEPGDGAFIFRTWHDFGGLASPLSEEWRVHVLADANRNFVVRHAPGSVRQMYQSAPDGPS